MDVVKKILITGGGAPGAPGIIKAIKLAEPNITIYSCDFAPHTAGKMLADEYFTVPMGNDPKYIDVLLKKVLAEKITTILPITTKELIPLSEHKLLFENENINVVVSDLEHLNIANNKGLLYTHLHNHGIATPKFAIASDFSEYQQAKEYLKSSEKKYIIKPCVSNGSRGFRIVDSSVSEHDLLFNHKPTSTYISEEKLDEILAEPFPPILLSEYLPGQEYTVDCFVQNGEAKLIVPRKREKMNNGISVEGTIENKTEIIAYCQAILDVLPLHGPIGIQVKYSKHNKPLIVEINPRIQGTTVACLGAGINIPHLAASDVEVDPQLQSHIKWGTKFIRHYTELYY